MFDQIPDELLLLILSFFDSYYLLPIFVSKRFLTIGLELFSSRNIGGFSSDFIESYEKCLLEELLRFKTIRYTYNTYSGHLFLRKLENTNFRVKDRCSYEGGFLCVLTNKKFFRKNTKEIQYISKDYHYYKFFVYRTLTSEGNVPKNVYDEKVVKIVGKNKDCVDHLARVKNFGKTRIYLLENLSKNFITTFLLHKVFGFGNAYRIAAFAFWGVYFEGTEISIENENDRVFYRHFFYKRCKMSIKNIYKYAKDRTGDFYADICIMRDVFFCKENIEFFKKSKSLKIADYPQQNEHKTWNLSLDEFFWFVLYKNMDEYGVHVDLPRTNIEEEVYISFITVMNEEFYLNQ